MVAKLEVFDQQGAVILDAASRVLVVREFRRLPNALTAGAGSATYYYSGEEETTKLVLIRPALLGNSIEGYTEYANHSPYMHLRARDSSEVLIADSTGNAVEVAIAEVGTASDSTGYLDVYAPDGTFSWSLGSFYKCVRVVSVTPISGIRGNTDWVSITIPSSVTDLNSVFIVPPYSIVQNQDNGTDTDYYAYGFKVKIVGRNLMFMFTGYTASTNTPVMPIPINLMIVEVLR